MNPVIDEKEAPAMAQTEAPIAESAESGAIDIDAIRQKMTIDPDVQDIYDKCLINGRRIMFSQETFGETSKYLDGPEPMQKKIADGVVAVVKMLWDKSNQSINPKVIVPVTLGLTLDGFEFLQNAGNPEATKPVLGEAVDMATSTIMQKFGVPSDQVQALVAQNQAAVNGQPTGQPEQPGILGAA